MEIPFIGGAYKGRSKDLNSQTCINLIPIVDQEGGKNVISFLGAPGCKSFCDSGVTAEVRGLHVIGSTLYAVIGDSLYSINTSGVATQITGTFTNSTGGVWMADDGTSLIIVDSGDDGYIHTIGGGTFAAIADADFPTPSSLCFMDGYFIVTKDSTGQFYISTQYDGTAWDATDYAIAEQFVDNLKACIEHKGQLWLLGEKSIEVWYNSGASFPFELISGSTITEGIDASLSLARDENSLFFLSDKKRIVKTVGYNLVPISTPTLDYQISTYRQTSDALGFTYIQEGRSFYQISFPTISSLEREGATWVYDIKNNLWHQRQSYELTAQGGTTVRKYQGRHRANMYAKFNGKHLIGDYEDGDIKELDLDTYTDDSKTIRRERAAQVIHKDRKTMFFHSFEIDFESGVGLTTGQGSDPQVMLDWSDDGGHNWSNEHWKSIGAIGNYQARAKWNRLGSSRNRIFRAVISDPVKVIMINAHADITLGVS